MDWKTKEGKTLMTRIFSTMVHYEEKGWITSNRSGSGITSFTVGKWSKKWGIDMDLFFDAVDRLIELKLLNVRYSKSFTQTPYYSTTKFGRGRWCNRK